VAAPAVPPRRQCAHPAGGGDHYDRVLGLHPSEQQKNDLAEYLKTL
jgi:hypothetical protein